MTEADIRAIVDRLAEVANVLADANPDDKAEIFRQLGLRLTYRPGERLVRATIKPDNHWQIDGVRGGPEPPCPRIFPDSGLTRRPGRNPLFGDFMRSD
jgi:hypothetical protein